MIPFTSAAKTFHFFVSDETIGAEEGRRIDASWERVFEAM